LFAEGIALFSEFHSSLKCLVTTLVKVAFAFATFRELSRDVDTPPIGRILRHEFGALCHAGFLP
jgi:hypothetical protein